MQPDAGMQLFQRLVAMHRRQVAERALDTRATCLRCRREYRLEPDRIAAGSYCWWCEQHADHDQAMGE